MPVFDAGPEPFNLPRDDKDHYALLAPGEQNSAPYVEEDRVPQYVPYNGNHGCPECMGCAPDMHYLPVDVYSLINRRAATAERERDLARTALVAAEAEISDLRRQIQMQPPSAAPGELTVAPSAAPGALAAASTGGDAAGAPTELPGDPQASQAAKKREKKAARKLAQREAEFRVV